MPGIPQFTNPNLPAYYCIRTEDDRLVSNGKMQVEAYVKRSNAETRIKELVRDHPTKPLSVVILQLRDIRAWGWANKSNPIIIAPDFVTIEFTCARCGITWRWVFKHGDTSRLHTSPAHRNVHHKISPKCRFNYNAIGFNIVESDWNPDKELEDLAAQLQEA